MEDIRDMDIIKNIRTVEWLKSELLTSLAYLYEVLIKDEDDNKKKYQKFYQILFYYLCYWVKG